MDEPNIKQILSKVLQEIFNDIGLYTIQIFHNDKPKWGKCPPEPIGTGVLLGYNEKYYVISAAHVVQPYATNQIRNPYKEEDDYEDPDDAKLSLENIGFYSNGFFYPLQRVVFTNTNNPIECNVDLAVIPLDIETADELRGQKKHFVDISLIGISHSISLESRYFVYGFPAEWTNLNSDKIVSRPLKLNTKGFIVEKGIDLNYDPRYNIFIEYNPNKLVYIQSDNKLDISSPNGISGCGLWYYNENNQLVLVGIMIENKLASNNIPIMMATRIDEVIYIINKYVG